MTLKQVADTQQAFDSVAATYDGPVGNNTLVQWIRARTLAAVIRSVPAGAALLDLGCGTGLDAVSLGRQGYKVTAIDWSEKMVRRARERVAQLGLGGVVAVQQLGIQQLDRLPPNMYDGIYSDLGSLNCVPDLAAAARAIAIRLRPGGVMVASVIGRVCPWELALFALKGQWRRALVRAGSGGVAVPLNNRTVWTWYYTPVEFGAAFGPSGFRRQSLRSLGVLAPPPYMLAFAERHPHAVARLQALEDRVAGWPGLRGWGDHFLIVMRRDG